MWSSKNSFFSRLYLNNASFFLLVLNEPIICLYDLLFEQDVILEKSTLLTDWFFSQNSLLCNRERINLSLTFVLSNKDLILWNLMRVEKSGKKLRSNCKYLKLQSRCSFPHCNLKALLIWSSLIVSTNFVIFIGLIVAYSGTTVG